MTEALFVLAKTNLVMSVAIALVCLLRRPVRALFHASITYALWLLVPAATLASMIPLRVAASATAAQIRLAIGGGALPALPAPHDLPPDWSRLLFAAWLAGAATLAVHLLRLQRDFHRAERAGTAGPAVAGFFRPRIVLPAGFDTQFSAAERGAILAHERAHLTRQDARINAMAALLRCLCWFNPLVHLASAWLRCDQELACDAAALRHVSRLNYANALLRAQMPVTSSLLGCAWPGSEHPLTERMTLLMRPSPQAARRRSGIFVIALVMLSGSVGAWAAQPKAAAPPAGIGDGYPSDMLTVTRRAGNKGPIFYLTLKANKFQDTGGDGGRLSGNVAMQFPYGMARADNATMTGTGQVTMTDNVSLLYGGQVMRGRMLTFDAHSGMLAMDGKRMPSGMPACNKPCR